MNGALFEKRAVIRFSTSERRTESIFTLHRVHIQKFERRRRMIKSRKFRRALAVISAVALMICMAQTAVFADNTVDVYNGTYADGSVTVTGSINAKGAEMTMLAVRTDDENIELDSFATPEDLANAVMYIDQITATSDNFENTWPFALRDSVSGDFVVVFVSGTDANTAKIAIPLEEKSGVNGTAEIAGTEFVGSLPDPLVVLTGGDDNWAGQLEIKAYDGDNEVDLATLEAPFEAKEYKVTVNNTSADYPAYSKEFTFSYISAAGDEFAKLPANLGVEVDKTTDENKYSFVVPEDTENIKYTVKVDGVDETNKSFDVEKSEVARTVVVTAKAEGSDAEKTYTVSVPAIGEVAPAITSENVEIINSNAYSLGKTLVAVTVGADVVDPATSSLTIGEDTIYYAPKKNTFYGVVNSALAPDAATAASNIVIGAKEEGALDLYFGVTVEKAGKEAQAAQDFSNALKKYLKKPVDLTEKQYIAIDVAAAKPDGKFNASDFSELLKLYLKKTTDLPVNAQ